MKQFEVKDLERFGGQRFAVLERFDGLNYTIEVDPHGIVSQSVDPTCSLLLKSAREITRYINTPIRLHCVRFGGDVTDHTPTLFDAATYIEVKVNDEYVLLPYEKADALFNIFGVSHTPQRSFGPMLILDAALRYRRDGMWTDVNFTQQFVPKDRAPDGFMLVPWQLTEDDAATAEVITFDDVLSDVMTSDELDFFRTADNMLNVDMIAEIKSEYSEAAPEDLVVLVRDYITQDAQYITKVQATPNLKQALDSMVNFKFSVFMRTQVMGF